MQSRGLLRINLLSIIFLVCATYRFSVQSFVAKEMKKLFVAVACAIAAAGLHLAASAAAVRISDAEETGVIRSAGSVGEDADPTSPTPLCGLDGFDLITLAL